MACKKHHSCGVDCEGEAALRAEIERLKEQLLEHEREPDVCTACNGSGHYDHNGSPPCGACGGKGWA